MAGWWRVDNPWAGRGGRTLALVLALVLLAGGSWWALRVALELRDWLDSDTWVATRSTGVVVQSGGGLRYGYEVDGWPYAGERTHFFLAAPYLDGRRRRWLDANRGATAVAVFYDPDAPARAVLVREVDPGLWIALGLGLVAVMVLVPVLVFGGLWWWLWRHLRR